MKTIVEMIKFLETFVKELKDFHQNNKEHFYKKTFPELNNLELGFANYEQDDFTPIIWFIEELLKVILEEK